MTTLNLVGLLFALSTSLGAIVGHIELWQRKEYRWDRVRALLHSPELSLRTLPLFSSGTLTLALGWLALGAFQLEPAELFGWASLALFAAHYGYRTVRRGLIRPTMTQKAILNLCASTLVSFCLLIINRNSALALATIIFVLPFITATIVGLINIPVWIKKRAIINHAADKRRQLSNLIVVGITGSVGKTSTKHFLLQLIQAAGKNILASAERRNAELPVAQDMMARLTPETEIYIAEMGAYRRGEVAAVAKLTQPRIGILTVLGNQHLDLFGSRENIVAAKWELIASLPANGIAILNADDRTQVTQAKEYSPLCPILWYSIQKPADVWVEKTVIHPTSITTQLHIKTETADIKLPLASEALLQSVVAAIAATAALGIPLAKLLPTLMSLQPYPQTMEIKTSTPGVTVIDDSYSANEAGVLMALHHLQRFPQKNKIVVLVPLIELGKESVAAHQAIGATLAKSQAHVYIWGHGQVAALKAGARTIDPYFHMHHFTDPLKLAMQLKRHLTSDTVVLLEGRLPDVVRKALV